MLLIRKMGLNDIEHTSEIYALSWKTAYKGIVPQNELDSLSGERWIPFLRKSYTSSFVALDGEKYVGTASFGASRDSTVYEWGEIGSIYVLPEYWGTGVGKALFTQAVTELTSLGYPNIYLWVLQQNYRARSFYERNGFQFNGDTISCKIAGKDLIEMRYVYNI